MGGRLELTEETSMNLRVDYYMTQNQNSGEKRDWNKLSNLKTERNIRMMWGHLSVSQRAGVTENGEKFNT